MINPYKKNAKLVLSNGIVFPGFYFGAFGTAIGEIVFNTGMTGYQEVITDPSYYGQILTFTFPEIGNTGINYEDSEKYVQNMNPKLSQKQNESISKNRFEYDINVWDSDIQKGTLIKKLTTPIETHTILIKPESSLVRESQIEKLKNNYLSFEINEIPSTSHMVIFESSIEVSKLISNHIQ